MGRELVRWRKQHIYIYIFIYQLDKITLVCCVKREALRLSRIEGKKLYVIEEKEFACFVNLNK